MTVADLTIGHIGKSVCVTHGAGSVTGMLVRIDAEAEAFDNGPQLGDVNATSSRDVMIGRTTVTLTIGRAVVPVRLDSAASVAP